MLNRPPIRPRPKNNENLKGYLLRLAASNGYFNISIIFNMLGIKQQKGFTDVKNVKFTDFSDKLAPMLFMEPEVFRRDFMAIHTFDISQSRVVKNIVSEQLKVCTLCLNSDEGYINHEWQKGHNTHCKKHSVRLIDQCPHCHCKLTWNSDIFDGCFRCGLRWEGFHPIKDSSIPIYQTVDELMSPSEKKEFIGALYKAAVIICNPNYFICNAISRWNYGVSESNEIFNKAFWLLISNENRMTFMKKLYGSLIPSISIHFLEAIKQLSHPVKDLPQLKLVSSSENLLSDELFLSDDCLLSDYQASKLLGLIPSELNELSRSLKLQEKAFRPTYEYKLIHIEEFLNEILNRSLLTESEFTKNYIAVSDLAKVSLKFLFSFGDTIKLLLRLNIDFYRHQHPSTFHDIYIFKDDLIKVLVKNEHTQFNRLFSYSELMRYFSIQRVKVNAIAMLFGWKTVTVSRSIVKFEAKDIKTFVDDYVLLDKWCDGELYPKSSLYKYLIGQGYNIVNVESTTQIKLHIFKKSEELLCSIKQFEHYWFKSKQPSHLKLQHQIQDKDLLSNTSLKNFEQRCFL